jgi:hypothetical protein
MTKRIIALVLVAVMAALALVSCTEAPATTAPAGTTPAGTAATTPEKSEAPETTEQQNNNTTPTPQPTPSEEPLPDDPFTYWGGSDAMWGTASVYGQGWETWPFEGNGSYCPRAFWQLCVILGSDDGDFTANVGLPEYEYTWKLWYKSEDDDPFVFENWKGPYTLYVETAIGYGDGFLYRPQSSACPEGDPCANFEVDVNYDFVIQVLAGEESQGFMYVSVPWTPRVNAEYRVYNDFWTKHDRKQGYKAADQTKTDADDAFAKEAGFEIGADGSIKYVG